MNKHDVWNAGVQFALQMVNPAAMAGSQWDTWVAHNPYPVEPVKRGMVELPYYSVHCSECGADSNDGSDWSAWSSEDGAESAAFDAGFAHTEDGRWLCEEHTPADDEEEDEPERCGFTGTDAEHRAMGCCPPLTTIECSRPGDRYTLIESGPSLIVHLAGPTEHGTGPCICGFDRHKGNVGFSVGGGVTGPPGTHEACADCARLAAGRPIRGLHAPLFAALRKEGE